MNQKIIPVVVLVAIVCVYPPVTVAAEGGAINASEEMESQDSDEHGINLVDDNQDTETCVFGVERLCIPEFWSHMPFGPITPVAPIVD